MRNLLLLIVLCLAGYWAYEHYLAPGPAPAGSGSAPAPVESNPQTSSVTGQFTMPDPVAWKEIERYSLKPGKTFVTVALVEGNHWRTESRMMPSSQIIVCVFDGTTFVSSSPKITQAITIDPESRLRNLFSEFNKLKPVGTEERDDHSCWLFRENSQGERGDGWIDKETDFPVLIEGWSAATGSGEIHFQLLKSDFSILRTTAFDTGNLAPMLAPFLRL